VVAAAVVEVQVCVDDDVDAGEVEVLLAQWTEAGIEVGHRRVQLVMPVSTSTRASGRSMTCTQTGILSPSASRSATRTGVMVIEPTAAMMVDM
jgi:hypothetical protein